MPFAYSGFEIASIPGVTQGGSIASYVWFVTPPVLAHYRLQGFATNPTVGTVSWHVCGIRISGTYNGSTGGICGLDVASNTSHALASIPIFVQLDPSTEVRIVVTVDPVYDAVTDFEFKATIL